MTRMSPRTNFHSSKLIRCLADLSIVDTADPGNAFAEKLGSWIHFADAIALSAVQNDSIVMTPKLQTNLQSDVQASAYAAAGSEFERIQAAMTNSIMKSFAPHSGKSGKSHITLPEPAIELPMVLRTAYSPYRRFYEAHQRDMELSIQALRTNVRETVAKASSRLKKLAELDAVLEKILRDRESKLLSKVPVLLVKRFEQLFKEHQQKLADHSAEIQQADNPAGWTKKNGWLTRFCNDMQMLLLAEMEFRLQPTMGLIEALKSNKQDIQDKQ